MTLIREDKQHLQMSLSKEQRCPFVSPEYWRDRRPAARTEALYWCSLHLKPFHPSVNLDIVRSNIVEMKPSDMP